MHSWIALLRRIPHNQQNTLAITTTTGIEVNVQDILRIEEDHLVIRGRQAGTTASGRVYFIPYQQLCFLCIQQELKEAQLRTLYDPSAGAALAEAEAQTPSTEPAALEAKADEAKPDAAPPPPETKEPLEPPKPGQLKIPRKSGLLERLRARAQAGAHLQQPPPSSPP
jgi:hypothetical protein